MSLPNPAGLSLLSRFTAASGLIASALALALGALVSSEVARTAKGEAVISTAQAAEMLLSPYLVKGDFAHPLWRGRLDDLDRMISRHLRSDGILRVRLWNRDGTVIYASDRHLIGLRSLGSAELAAALDGQVSAVIGAGGDWPLSGGSHEAILAVFVPVRLWGAAIPDGVYEVHRDAAPLLAHTRTAQRRAWMLVFAGVAVLYGSLFGLVHRASRTLAAQHSALQELFDGTVQALAAAVDARDAYTGDHSMRVAHYAETTARALGLSDQDVRAVRLASYLHDVGKIGISDRLLLKAGALDEREWAEVRRHALIGDEILRPVPIDERVRRAVRHTHERWDGSGYPDGLAGEAIPIHARILMVADAFEAMTSQRPYRAALSRAEAIEELRRCAGNQFDPFVVDALVTALKGPEPRHQGKAPVVCLPGGLRPSRG